MIRKVIVATFLAASLGSFALPATSDALVRIAPPPLRAEVAPPPRHGHVWVAGHWEWRNRHHQWVRGSWIRERPGYRYSQPTWVQREGHWTMERGHWRRGSR